MSPNNVNKEYFKTFLKSSTDIIDLIDINKISMLKDALLSCRENNGRVFVAGSGGGAGHSSHLVCDLRKICSIESYSITDNVSELTARINDESWESSYVSYLRGSKFNKKDLLFVLSVGGGDVENKVSLNLVNCIDYANEMGGGILGIVGRDGGYLNKVSKMALIIPTINESQITQQVEGFQSLIWHMLVGHPDLKLTEMRWESIKR